MKKKPIFLLILLFLLALGLVFGDDGTDYKGTYIGPLYNLNTLQSAQEVTFNGSTIAGGNIIISGITVGGDNNVISNGKRVGTWAYLYSSGAKIGIVCEYTAGVRKERQLILGSTLVNTYISVGYGPGFGPVDTRDMGDIIQGALVKS